MDILLQTRGNHDGSTHNNICKNIYWKYNGYHFMDFLVTEGRPPDYFCIGFYVIIIGTVLA